MKTNKLYMKTNKLYMKKNILYMKTNIYIYLLSHLAQFFLEREMFQTKVVEKIKTRFVFNEVFETIVSFKRKCKKPLW